MTESKSLLEVWEWKEAVYNDTKDMTTEGKLKYFNEGAEKAISRLGYKKKMIGENVYKLVKVS